VKPIVVLSVGILVALSLVFGVNAQTPEPLPTVSRIAPPWDVFPTNLYCYDIDRPAKGPSWGEITIGTSDVETLKDYVATIGDYDSISQWGDYISFYGTGSLRDESGPPPLIEACLDVDTQIVTALQVSNNRPLSIQDLVALYGTPDIVTWGSGNISRTVIWFEEGIAALVYILEASEILDYGEIGLIVYFPYQTDQAFEERWPFNRTNSENPIGGDRVYDPPPSEEQNPFNFEVMIATITAQPSRTPTPTPSVTTPPSAG
jgi:hypothetical protein